MSSGSIAVGSGERDTGWMAGVRKDLFISHAGADRAWAEWVAWQLTDAGYTVELDAWDWPVGANFVLAMNDALERCDRVVALCSAAYFDRSRYTTEEWTAATLHVPGLEGNRLIPVRVADIPPEEMPAVLRLLVFCDVFGLDVAEAKRVLLAAVKGPQRPGGEPEFPGRGTPGGLRQMGGSGPRLPGSLPRVWNLSARNAGFTGRDGLLVQIRQRLVAGGRVVAQALQGMGGVGKTQLAVEYAHRFAGDYELAWWVNAEQGGLIGDQFAALGAALACVDAGAGVEAVRSAVLAELRQRDRWLLVFDNAEKPADVTPWLPGGNGHVLITSREHGWAEVAAPVEVDVLERSESLTLLRERVTGLTVADAGRLAEQLGDLPLALAQAAGFLAEGGASAGQYLDLLRTRAGELLTQGAPGSYPKSLAAATVLTVERLEREDPAAAQLANLCAFLAPEPIPLDLFTTAGAALPDELAPRARDPLSWQQTLAHLARQGLARVDQRGIVMHRLTQAVLRDRLIRHDSTAVQQQTEAMLAASDPEGADNPVGWPRWAVLIPHLLATDLASTSNPNLRWMACNGCYYLLARGDTRTGHSLARHLYQSWRQQFGEDDQSTLTITVYLAQALRELGRYGEARNLNEDTLALRRRVLGEDHPSTLNSAHNLAIDLHGLGEYRAARELDEDTLARYRRVLGEDHPGTLTSAHSIAGDLRGLGEYRAARELDEDTLARYRRVLGEDHPSTLNSASNLALDLHKLGEHEAAQELEEDTLARRSAKDAHS